MLSLRVLNFWACLQEGWLSASGRLKRGSSDDAVEVAFDRFWVDLGSNSLRPTLGAQCHTVTTAASEACIFSGSTG